MNETYSIGIHWMFVSIFNYYGLVLNIDQLMNRRRSLLPLSISCGIRAVITTCLVMYMYHFYGLEAVSESKIMVVYSSVMAVLQTGVLFWIYENAGASLVGAVAEMLQFFVITIAYIPVQLVNGTKLFGSVFLDVFRPGDLLLPIIYLPMLYLFLNKGQFVFSQFRKFRFENKFLWITLSLFIFGYSKFLDMSPYFSYVRRSELVLGIFIIIPVSAMLWTLYESGMDLEHDFLLKQKKMQHVYYGALRSQIYTIQKDMEQSQRHILGLLEEERNTEGDIHLEQYIARMKKRSHDLSAGIYCQNQMVDSLLFSYHEMCDENEIHFEVTQANISSDQISEDALFELLINVMDLGMKNEKDTTLTVTLKQIKDKLVIDLKGISHKPDSLSVRRIKELSNDCNGFYDLSNEEDGYRMTVYLGKNRIKSHG